MWMGGYIDGSSEWQAGNSDHCRWYAHQEENLNQNLLKMFDIFEQHMQYLVYTIQVQSTNIIFSSYIQNLLQ